MTAAKRPPRSSLTMSGRSAPGSSSLALFLVAAGVYAERDGRILILRRAVGALTGFWSMPGGLVDRGETPEMAVRRELLEETGLRLSGPLSLVGVTPMHIYEHDCVRLVYAGPCGDGEVVLSHEHADAQWIRPAEYRDAYLSDAAIAAWRQRDAHEAAIIDAVRVTFEDYLRWRARREGGSGAPMRQP